MLNFSITEETRKYNGEKRVSSINGLGKLESSMKKNETGPLSYTIYNNKLKMNQNL